jgi:hypothetical protein
MTTLPRPASVEHSLAVRLEISVASEDDCYRWNGPIDHAVHHRQLQRLVDSLFFSGLCCVEAALAARDRAAVRFGSDGAGEFGERGRDAPMGTRINSEFVVAAPNVLHERVTAHDDPRGPVAFEGHCCVGNYPLDGCTDSA